MRLKIKDDEDGEVAREKWNRIRNNDPSVTHLILRLKNNTSPSFYQNLATALHNNTNITQLSIDSTAFTKSIPQYFFLPIFESSNYIETLEICIVGNIHDDVFGSLMKSKKTKITKLKIRVTNDIMGPLARFLSANMMIENQMLKLILKQKIGEEASNKISDEFFPTNSMKELYLCKGYEYISVETFRPLLEAIGTIQSLESLHIDLYNLLPRKEINSNLITSLEKMLFNNKKLKKVFLDTRKMKLQDLEKMALAFQKSPSLESLHFFKRTQCNIPIKVKNQDEIKKWFAKISNKHKLEISCKVYKDRHPNECLRVDLTRRASYRVMHK